MLDSISPANLVRFALELGVPQKQIDVYDHDTRYFNEKQAKIIDYWLKNGEKRSWKELQRALYAVDERKAGDQIESEYLRKHWKDPRVCLP